MQRRIMNAFLMVIFSVLITAGTVSAENSLKKDAKALSFGIVDSGIEVSGRLFVDNDLAVLGGIGFALHDNDESTTDYSLSAGIRKYLAKSDLAPFVGGILSYSRDEFVVGAGPTVGTESEKTLELAGVFGMEYFFAKQVSAEAQIGFGFSSRSAGGADETTIGTFSSGVTVNFYLP